MATGKAEAILEALNVLRQIDGTGGYKCDFQGRVYTRDLDPMKHTDVKLPFISMPLRMEAERPAYEARSVDRKWRMIVRAYFEDDEDSSPLDTKALVPCANFSDDLSRAFMLNGKLAGRVIECKLGEINTDSGGPMGYAVVVAEIVFWQIATEQDLAKV